MSTEWHKIASDAGGVALTTVISVALTFLVFLVWLLQLNGKELAKALCEGIMGINKFS
ncbi:hypothetical protein I5L38_01935 [Serratia marcescens]|nr:hypothetical protein [Serratia marcescens]